MQPTKIEWLHWLDGRPGYSWNPIKGICPVGCWYCYARKLYRRFKCNPKLRLSSREVFADMPQKPSRIFVCSTMEIFHPRVMPGWRETIFSRIVQNPQHAFFILTKLPQNIDRPMPENVFLGATVTGLEDYPRKIYLFKHKAQIRFVSYEPILNQLPPSFGVGLDWLILGRLTGHGNKKNPDLDFLKDMVTTCKDLRVPVFMKQNLARVWPGKLVQEFPR